VKIKWTLSSYGDELVTVTIVHEFPMKLYRAFEYYCQKNDTDPERCFTDIMEDLLSRQRINPEDFA